MRILVTGAYGFIGSHIVNALHADGHKVLCAVRKPDRTGRFAYLAAVSCDLARDIRAEDWIPRLRNVDAVVNAAGILRENRRQKFTTIHHTAPRALFEACPGWRAQGGTDFRVGRSARRRIHPLQAHA